MAVTSSHPNPSINVSDNTSSSSSRPSSDSYRTSSILSSTSHESDSQPISSVSSSSQQQSTQSQNPSITATHHDDENGDHDKEHADEHYDEVDALEPMSQAEREARVRKRDYAVEISRIMGRQLVAAMNSGKKNSRGGLSRGFFDEQGDWSPIREH